MLKVSLDEGFVFDMLSILHVKLTKTNDNKVLNSLIKLEEEIDCGIGREKRKEIINSHQYKDLKKVNLRLFDLIDQQKKDPLLPAKSVDDLNYERYLLKKDIQRTFFNEEIQEQKFGYS